MALHPLDCFIDIAYQLVVSHHEDDRFGSVEDRCYAVGVAVHVIDLAVLGDGVGGGQENIGGERLAVDRLHFVSVGGLRTVKEVVFPAFHQVKDAAFRKRHRASAGNGIALLHKPSDYLNGLCGALRDIGFDIVLSEIFGSTFELAFKSSFYDLIHMYHSVHNNAEA